MEYDIGASKRLETEVGKRLLSLHGDSFSDLVQSTPYSAFLGIELDYDISLLDLKHHWFLRFKVIIYVTETSVSKRNYCIG